MTFTHLVPNVFYTHLNDALKLFVECLGFRITHEEPGQHFYVIEKDGLRNGGALAGRKNPFRTQAFSETPPFGAPPGRQTWG